MTSKSMDILQEELMLIDN